VLRDARTLSCEEGRQLFEKLRDFLGRDSWQPSQIRELSFADDGVL
jgi:hypothetical protein